MNNTLDSLNETVQNQAKAIVQLNQTIKELNEKLNKNSKNSSKPPSSDGFNKPAPKSLRKSSGKKAGAQKGHKGSHLSITREPNETITHMPSKCDGCNMRNTCKSNACISETRKVIDANFTVEITAHETLVIHACPMSGEMLNGKFPENIKATVQYGENLQALVVSLNTIGAVSVKRTHEMLSSVFNIPLATGTISSMVKKCADKLTGVFESIRQKVVNSSLTHFDETGTRVDGNTKWVHNASNSEYTFLTIHDKRGHLGMDASGVLPEFRGIAVHDCWASYWKYPDIQHAICCAHLLRELTGVEDNHPLHKWATDFKELLLEMKNVKDKAINSGKEALSYYHLHKFNKKYDEVIKLAYEQNPLPASTEKKRGRKPKGKVLSLIERLATYKALVCLFIKTFEVPFDNNQAERDIRMIKTKSKVSGCFRSMSGAQDYLKIMSYVGTAKKQKINAYTAIRQAILGTPEFIWG